MAYPNLDFTPGISSQSARIADQRSIRTLQLFRMLIASVITFFIAETLTIGVDLPWLIAASLLGVALAGRMLQRGYSFIWAAACHAALFMLLKFGFDVANFLVTAPQDAKQASDFMVAELWDQVFLVCLFYTASFLSTWAFWTRAGAATLEGIIFSAAFVWLMSGHRNYHLDAPKQVSSQTWKLDILQRYHVEPQHLFIALAVIFFCTLTAYFYLSSNRPLFGKAKEIRSSGKKRILTAPLIPLLLLAALLYYSKLLNERYSADLSKATEGVGEAAKQGQSNLGFHKAVGQTNQPAALVRLEGDYDQNPWAPMLYFREGALSEFNGKEMVVAAPLFDTDVPRVQPGQPFIGLPQEPSVFREKVVQSIYLLAKHNAPFAIDYPQRIALVKNPDPERFTLAYQAISQAPNVKLGDLIGRAVGDSHWDQATLAHYLRAPGTLTTNPPAEIPLLDDQPVLDEQHEDLRYLALSRKLSGAFSDPLARSEAIINYLSEESVYTRDPGHQVSPEGDPVAPYLFAPPRKKRGYCVHFAHAAVYLLRLAGIPARIGTGYLTDLQYAKDGHILLQMGDRHAWPEIYVEGLGWTITDINPAQAENEQAPVPDEKLLEELMGKINPTEELIAPPEIAQDKPKGPSVLERIADSKIIVPAAWSLLGLFLLLKLWLRFGYRLTVNDHRRIKRAYTAFAAELSDLGIQRQHGETRQEFRRRLKNSREIEAASITRLNEFVTYSKNGVQHPSSEVQTALSEWKKSYDSKNWRVKRVAAFFSPRSLIRWRSW